MRLLGLYLSVYSLLVAARPAPHELHERKTHVSLSRSSNAAFVDVDGVVDHAMLKSQLIRTARYLPCFYTATKDILTHRQEDLERLFGFS